MDNENYKKHAHARVCEENKLEELEEKNDAYCANLKDHIQ